ncbi:hypothetical protein H9P43_004405 [Blastocladiella emersonii ATCC 22665]|nr:hypothetical protein H9P43_004405 [Blastocladiella emersonii ATCC 22665]
MTSAAVKSRNSAVALLWAKYVALLAARPVLTKARCPPAAPRAATSSFLNFLQENISDALASAHPNPYLTLEKALKMAGYGFLISGPLGHYLYAALNAVFDGSSVASMVGQMLGANLVVAPIQNAVYLSAMALIAGRTDIASELRQGLLPLMKLTWSVFPAVQLVAVKFLPPNLWLPYFNFMSFIFGVYTNYKIKKAHRRRRIADGKRPRSTGDEAAAAE